MRNGLFGRPPSASVRSRANSVLSPGRSPSGFTAAVGARGEAVRGASRVPLGARLLT